MKQSYTFFLILICAFLSSCSFNKRFLAPEKIPPYVKRGVFADPVTGDTSILHIGENFQPSFTDSKNNMTPSSYTIESILFKSSSGNILNGWLLRPNDPSAVNTTILFMHGNGGNILSEYQALTPLLERGFQFFVFDYSGYGFSQGKASRSNVLKDANSALAYLRGRPEIQNTKLVLYGQSLGGNVATVVAAQNENKIDALVTEGAFSSHKDIGAYNFKPGFLARVLIAEKYSASGSISKFHKPVLIIHSTEDKTVPFYMGQKLYAKANQPKTFYPIQHEHVQGPQYYADSISYKIRSMLK